MVYVKIGSEERRINEAYPRWITQSIVGLRREGLPACIQVRFDEPRLCMVLTTPGCQRGGGGGRPPNTREREVFELWERLGLNDPAFPPGNLIAFLRRL